MASRNVIRPSLRQGAGLTLLTLSYLGLPVLLMVTYRLSQPANAAIRWSLAAVMLLAMIPFWPWATWAARRGRRLLSISADEVLATESRAPVVYLRPFQHDELPQGPDSGRDLLQTHFLPKERIGGRPEERLVLVAHGVGPMIAIGRPGEHCANRGSQALRATHDRRRALEGRGH